MTIAFTSEDWARIRHDYTAWWQGRLERPLLYFNSVHEGARQGPPLPRFLPQVPPEVPPEEVVERFLQSGQQQRFPADSFPVFFMNFGAGILAGFLGATVNVRPETVWFEPPPGADVAKLDLRLDRDSYWWRRMAALTAAAVERMGDVVQVSHTDLGGNADILASLIGTETLLMELYDRPEPVLEAMARIRAAWMEAFDELTAIIGRRCPGTVPWSATWAPGPTYMLQSDFCYMISPDMFERFVLPDLVECCERIEYPFYHLDGVGELPHLDRILRIEKLRGIQWIPGAGKPPAEEWPDLLRKIRDAGKLMQVPTSPDGVRRICREIGGRGIQFRIRGDMTTAEAEAFREEICNLSPIA